MAEARVAIIGGSGFYELDDDAPTVEPATPWGPPSSPITLGTVEGQTVAFLARHGRQHGLPPHKVDHRANLWALRDIGVTTVLASFACGSLVPELGPGALLVPDQLIDRTTGRADTVHDTFAGGPQHAAFAEPYDAGARASLLATGHAIDEPAHDGGTVIVINGPRFATRAESRWYRSIGADVINMTQYPETVIARELGLSYAALGLVTDHDAGLEEAPDVEAVTMDAVLEVFAQHLPRLRTVLLTAAAAVARTLTAG